MTRSHTSSLRLYQFTDTHLCAVAGKRLLGVDTQRCLDAVLELAGNNGSAPDLVLATGDLAQEAAPATYQRLRDSLNGFGVASYWLPGNHDDPAMMEQHLSGGVVSADKRVLLDDWQVLLLDSTIPGQVAGNLGDAELARLDSWLAGEPGRHALVCLHHHPVNMNNEWMKPIGLSDRDALFEVLDRYPNVRGVLWGHVHQEWIGQRNGVTLMSTPSTCFQFRPNSREFALDDRLPGYRELVLNPDGTVQSRVLRLTDFDLELDPDSKGY